MSLAEHVRGWAPAPVETTDAVRAWAVEAFAAALDVPSPISGTGDVVPPLWHWFAFLDHPARAELGADGHPADGHFLPPVPDRRRMFAGGRLELRAPLRVGEPVLRRSTLTAVTAKRGRSGEMLFTTVRHEFLAGGVVRVVEEQDVVYRSQPAGTARPAAPEPQLAPAAPPEPEGPWRITLDPDAALLFRMSALTYNTHRIHYDQAYATGTEGYPGLVVHGPLLALLLLELPRRFAPQQPVGRFGYRLERPAFAGVPVLARREPGGGLVAGVAGAPASVRGEVHLG
ncbi:MAG: FAS1-like dehydratase domain-containing protein [Pseudonocardia sp.]